MPRDFNEKKSWMDKMVAELLCKLDQEGSGIILFIKQGRSNGRFIRMVEVGMETKEMAKRIRNCYVTQKRRTWENSLWQTVSAWQSGSELTFCVQSPRSINGA